MKFLFLDAAGSTHVPQSRAIFEVKKSTGMESSSPVGAAGQPVSEEQGKEILSITIFRELRGSSEVVIFLSPSPVRGTL